MTTAPRGQTNCCRHNKLRSSCVMPYVIPSYIQHYVKFKINFALSEASENPTELSGACKYRTLKGLQLRMCKQPSKCFHTNLCCTRDHFMALFSSIYSCFKNHFLFSMGCFFRAQKPSNPKYGFLLRISEFYVYTELRFFWICILLILCYW